MPLLNRPNPIVPQRQYRVRINEPLAVMMERYAEFLGSENVDYIINEALGFVFKKDSEFNQWLAKHPAATPPAEAPKGKPNGGTIAAQKAPEMAATVRATI